MHVFVAAYQNTKFKTLAVRNVFWFAGARSHFALFSFKDMFYYLDNKLLTLCQLKNVKLKLQYSFESFGSSIHTSNVQFLHNYLRDEIRM